MAVKYVDKPVGFKYNFNCVPLLRVLSHGGKIHISTAQTGTDGRVYSLPERKIHWLKDFLRECGRYSPASRARERLFYSALRLTLAL